MTRVLKAPRSAHTQHAYTIFRTVARECITHQCSSPKVVHTHGPAVKCNIAYPCGDRSSKRIRETRVIHAACMPPAAVLLSRVPHRRFVVKTVRECDQVQARQQNNARPMPCVVRQPRLQCVHARACKKQRWHRVPRICQSEKYTPGSGQMPESCPRSKSLLPASMIKIQDFFLLLLEIGYAVVGMSVYVGCD